VYSFTSLPPSTPLHYHWKTSVQVGGRGGKPTPLAPAWWFALGRKPPAPLSPYPRKSVCGRGGGERVEWTEEWRVWTGWQKALAWSSGGTSKFAENGSSHVTSGWRIDIDISREHVFKRVGEFVSKARVPSSTRRFNSWKTYEIAQEQYELQTR